MSNETGLPLKWSDTENIAWKTDIPGEGWSSPVVWDDRVFVTTATEEGVSCRALCIDRKTGLLAGENSESTVFQPFLQGTVPTEMADSARTQSESRRQLRLDSF